VNLYWNIGRIITQDIQKNEKRAGYGEQLIEELAKELGKEYESGYSTKNLWGLLSLKKDSGCITICEMRGVKWRLTREW